MSTSTWHRRWRRWRRSRARARDSSGRQAIGHGIVTRTFGYVDTGSESAVVIIGCPTTGNTPVRTGTMLRAIGSAENALMPQAAAAPSSLIEAVGVDLERRFGARSAPDFERVSTGRKTTAGRVRGARYRSCQAVLRREGSRFQRRIFTATHACAVRAAVRYRSVSVRSGGNDGRISNQTPRLTFAVDV